MNNKKGTKRALLTSLLMLLLSCSMFVGSTFAWFTDNVVSGNNIIKSGNLDIELEYWNGTNWTEVNGASDIITNTLWEPGVTEVAYLRVANAGSLALKYQLGINIINESAGTNQAGETFKLSDYIQFGVVEGVNGETNAYSKDDAGRAAAIAAVTDSKKISAGYTKDSSMEPNDVLYLALVVYMPTTVDNVANHNGENVPQIDLGINVYATQMTSEEDSFNDQYDDNAGYYDVLVSSVDELYDVVSKASGDIVIAVDGNIVLTKDLSKSGLNSIKFVAFDEDATIDQATSKMSFSGAKVTFDGLTLTHGEKQYGDGGQTSTAFAVWHAKEVNYIDCTFNRSVGTIHASLHNFIRCTFNGVENPDNSKSEYPLYICDGQDYNVVDCVFNCTNRGAILFYNDSGSGVDTLNISNTKFLGNIIDDKTAVEIHNNSNTQTYNVNIKDVIVGNGVINGLYRIKPANVGEVNVIVDGSMENVTFISTADDLVALGGTKINGNYILTSDINMDGKEMKSMELSGGANVNFIGNGKTISNLNLTAANIHGMTGKGNEVAGLFDLSAPATTVSLTVSDLVIKQATVTCAGYAATIVGYNSNGNTTITLNNVDVEGATVTAESVAALVGYTTGPVSLTDCGVSDLKLTGEAGRPEKVGALVGTANTQTCVVNITNCSNATDYNYVGRVINGANATVGDAAYVADNEGLKTAINSSDNVNVTLAAGEYKLPASNNKTVTISGTKDTVIDLSNGSGFQAHGMTYVFDGVTIKGANSNYNGIVHSKSVAYKNCTLTGLQFLYAETVTFENCDFDSMGAEHSIWTYSAKNISFIDCDFTYADRCINAYCESGDKQVVNFKNCTFNSTNPDSKGAVEINSSYFTTGIEVNMNNCMDPEYGTMVGISGYDTENGAKTTVTVDGKSYRPNQWDK